MNIQQALHQAEQSFVEEKTTASLDAQVLLSHILQCNTAHLIAWPEKELNKEQEEQYLHFINQRKQGVPVAHLIKQREFWSLNFSVNDSTLIPRPETETLVEYILEKFSHKEDITLLDMGTGTGAIAIAIAHERPAWKIVASELSKDALALAKKNSVTNKINNIAFIQSNWLTDISQHDFDIIVSNPPYIATNDPHLIEGDVRFEPKSALVSGESGMDAIEHICLHATSHLKNNGYLIIEHGYNQKQLVADCFTKNRYKEVEHCQDLSGHTRMTAGRL